MLISFFIYVVFLSYTLSLLAFIIFRVYAFSPPSIRIIFEISVCLFVYMFHSVFEYTSLFFTH